MIGRLEITSERRHALPFSVKNKGLCLNVVGNAGLIGDGAICFRQKTENGRAIRPLSNFLFFDNLESGIIHQNY